MNPRQLFALLNPLIRSLRWATDPKYHFRVDIGELVANVELVVFGSLDGEPPAWFVYALLVDSDNALLPLARLSDEGRDWLRQMASGLLEGIGTGDTKILNTYVGVLVFKDLSSAEIETLPAEATLPPRRAVTQVKTAPSLTLTTHASGHNI
jgi:hypothetical protein